jgi:methyl-accepting chemotaxis protein
VRWFNNMRLAAKLFVAFGVVLAIVLAVGLFASARLRLVGEQSKNITEDALPSIIALRQIEKDTAQMRINGLRIIVSESPEEEARYATAIRTLLAKLTEEVSVYSKKLLMSGRERLLWGTYSTKWQSYVDVQADAMQLLQSGKRAEARKKLYEDGKGSIDGARDAFDQVVALNVEHASTFAAESNRLVAGSAESILAAVALNILFGAAVAWLIAAAVSRPIGAVSGIFGRIAGGKLDNAIDLDRKDEIGRLMLGLHDMQGQLLGQLTRERQLAAASGRIQSALDQASAKIMVADATDEIIYANATALRMFRERETEVRGVVPSFKAERLIGSSLGEFLKNSGQLAQVTAAQSITVKFGGFTAVAAITPIVDERREHCGRVVEWVDRTQEIAIEEEVNGVVKAALEGDLVHRLSLAGKQGFFESLSLGMNRLLDNMAEAIGGIRTAAIEVQRGADEISAGNSSLSQRTEQQASSLEETASSMEEMTSSVRQTADNASAANQLAAAARSQAETGGAVVGTAMRAMADINSSSKKIADIIGVIDEIAFQTNLLALNAAVEAARAGEQGRGFAVVASEVRNLAGRSATAAKEIKALIEDSVVKVESGSLLVTQSGQTLEEIVISVKKVSDIVAEMAAASREQSSGIEQVNRAVMQMDEMTQQNAALVEQATAASQSMAGQARSLSETMSRYQLKSGGPAGAATTPAYTRPGAPAAGKTPRALPPERRSVERPWSKAPPTKAVAAARKVQKVAVVVPAATEVASPTGSADWEEF